MSPERTPEQIRSDIVAQQRALGESVGELRAKWAEVSDWRSQLRAHRRELMIGAAVAGFAVGMLAMRRRRKTD